MVLLNHFKKNLGKIVLKIMLCCLVVFSPLIFFGGITTSYAATVTLQWDVNPANATLSLSHYILKWGATKGGPYPNLSGNIPISTPTFITPDLDISTNVYSFVVVVVDTLGQESNNSNEVSTLPPPTAPPQNSSPTANAGTDQSVAENVLVTLDGSNSTDPDGAITSYLWTQIMGKPVSFDDPTKMQPIFLSPVVDPGGEAFEFQLTVIDNGGLQSSDTCIVNVVSGSNPPPTVPPPNESPTANAGFDQSVPEGGTVTLDGRSSTDPDDGIASYLWTQIAGNPVSLNDPTITQPAFLAPNVGTAGATLTFQLAVADHGGLQSSDTIVINILWVNEAPTADAGPDQSVNEGVIVTLDGSNSTDPDDGIASYLWTQLSGSPVSLNDPTAMQPTFLFSNIGPEGASFMFQLTATDNGGLQSLDTSIVNVVWVNEPPTADAGPDQSVNEGVIVTLDGSNSTDPDDGIASYLWTQLSGSPVSLDNPTAMQPTFFSPDVVPNGASFMFQQTVTDNGGLQSSDTSIVNVVWVNEPPTANAGPDQSVIEGVKITLSGSNSTDSDDGIASYLWTQVAGNPVTLNDPTAMQPTFQSPNVGPGGESLTFQLTVADNGGLKSSDQCIVLVNEKSSEIDLTGAWEDLELDYKKNNYQIEGKLRVRNVSNQNAPASFLRIYLSQDNGFGGTDILLRETKIKSLRPWDSIKISLKKMIGKFEPGSYMIAIIDATNLVPEIDETNNIILSWPLY